MNKLFALLASLTLTTGVFAKDLNVSVQNNTEANNFSIQFSTIRTNSSMCHLDVTKLDLVKPTLSPRSNNQNNNLDGKITITAELNFMTMCMHAFGPHRGALALTQGYSLPALTNGTYELSINGESYGKIVLAENGVNLVTEEADLNEITVTGKFMTGIMAIGGETTGSIIVTESGTYELDLSLHNEIFYEAFEGKQVKVTGVLESREGVEIPMRKVIVVESFKSAN